LALNCADGVIHLDIDIQEHLKNVLRGVWILKQGRLPFRSTRIIPQGPD